MLERVRIRGLMRSRDKPMLPPLVHSIEERGLSPKSHSCRLSEGYGLTSLPIIFHIGKYTLPMLLTGNGRNEYNVRS